MIIITLYDDDGDDDNDDDDDDDDDDSDDDDNDDSDDYFHQLVRGNAAQADHYQRTLPAVLESLQVILFSFFFWAALFIYYLLLGTERTKRRSGKTGDM